MLPLLFLLRFGLGALSYAAATPGGLFAPMLVLGAQLGLFFGLVCRLAFPALDIQPEGFAVVGIAAFFTGVVRAPLTGMVLVTEMTASVSMLLPLTSTLPCGASRKSSFRCRRVAASAAFSASSLPLDLKGEVPKFRSLAAAASSAFTAIACACLTARRVGRFATFARASSIAPSDQVCASSRRGHIRLR